MLRKFFASFFILIFSVFFSTAFTVFVLLNTLLSTDYYRGDVSLGLRNGFAEVLPSLIYSNPEVSNPSNYLKTPSREALTAEIKKNLSVSDVEALMTDFIDQITHQKFNEKGEAWMSVDLSVFSKKVPALKKFVSPEPLKFHTVKGEPNSFISVDILWNIFWILFAANVLLLGIIGLIIYTPWTRVVKWVSKSVWVSAITMAATFYALYKAPLYLGNWDNTDTQGFGNNFGAFKTIMEAVISPFAKYSYVLALWIFFISFGLYISIFIYERTKKNS